MSVSESQPAQAIIGATLSLGSANATLLNTASADLRAVARASQRYVAWHCWAELLDSDFSELAHRKMISVDFNMFSGVSASYALICRVFVGVYDDVGGFDDLVTQAINR